MARFPLLKTVPLPGGPKVTAHMIKDNYQRHMVARNEVARNALKYLAQNTELPLRTRMEAQLQLHQLPRYVRPTEVRNRCIESGSARTVNKTFKLCRQKFREHALKGNLAGVRPASW